jgi:hypothetical protein
MQQIEGVERRPTCSTVAEKTRPATALVFRYYWQRAKRRIAGRVNSLFGPD